LIDLFVHLIGKGREDICKLGKRSIERSMLMESLYCFSKVTQPEIGRLVGGIDYSAENIKGTLVPKRLANEEIDRVKHKMFLFA